MQKRRKGSSGSEKKAFAVGLRTRRATAIVLVAGKRAPFAGPFILQAVVSSN